MNIKYNIHFPPTTGFPEAYRRQGGTPHRAPIHHSMPTVTYYVQFRDAKLTGRSEVPRGLWSEGRQFESCAQESSHISIGPLIKAHYYPQNNGPAELNKWLMLCSEPNL